VMHDCIFPYLIGLDEYRESMRTEDIGGALFRDLNGHVR